MSEHFDVLIVGAGISGISAAWHIQDRCPTKTYAVLEARDDMGGTWNLFKYPGIRSDSDMYTLGFRFSPWNDSRTLADGPSILDYVHKTAANAGIDGHVRYRQKVVGAAWNTETQQWTVEVDHDGKTIEFLPVLLQWVLRLRPGLLSGVPRGGRFQRHRGAPTALARRPGLQGQEGGRDRLRRHRRDAGSGDGARYRPHHHAAAFAHLHHVAAQ
ncbi:Probable monooxygenase EthA [Mycobacteroides abscessus subsp. abscessus]|nr:Probable monooxygenase EthA [Mycobacteroides abscessus subsp. abscessus]